MGLKWWLTSTTLNDRQAASAQFKTGFRSENTRIHRVRSPLVDWLVQAASVSYKSANSLLSRVGFVAVLCEKSVTIRVIGGHVV